MKTFEEARELIRASYLRHEELRAKKMIKVLKVPPVQELPPTKSKTGLKCKAVTQNGKQCQYSASCDGYCKRHAISKELLELN